MKTSNTILCSIAGVVLVAAILLMVRLWPQTLRDDECSPLYQRYCHTPGIEASFVKGFRINDTLAIDATLLQLRQLGTTQGRTPHTRTQHHRSRIHKERGRHNPNIFDQEGRSLKV